MCASKVKGRGRTTLRREAAMWPMKILEELQGCTAQVEESVQHTQIHPLWKSAKNTNFVKESHKKSCVEHRKHVKKVL